MVLLAILKMYGDVRLLKELVKIIKTVEVTWSTALAL